MARAALGTRSCIEGLNQGSEINFSKKEESLKIMEDLRMARRSSGYVHLGSFAASDEWEQ
jgi:hypothetical protein